MNKTVRNVLTAYLNYTADYPKHPDNVVINPSAELSKKDKIEGYKIPKITEQEIWSFYDGIKSKIFKELKGKNLFVRLKTDTGFIYIRHPFSGNSEFIRINDEKDFNRYNNGRIVEIHTTMSSITDEYVVDFDAVGDWKKTLEITGEIADGLEKLPGGAVSIRYTGKRGFHILKKIKPIPIDKARETLKEWLKQTFGDRTDLVVGESPSGSKGALGVSPMKLNGGQVALWSLRVTGLCCVEVPRASLGSFKREDASLEKTYKKLTGKTFIPVEQKKAAERVVLAFSKISAENWPEIDKDSQLSKVEFRKPGPFYKLKKVHLPGHDFKIKDIEELKYLKQNGYLPSEQDAFAMKDTPENLSTYTIYFNTFMPLSDEDKELTEAEEINKGEIDKLPPLKYVTREDTHSFLLWRGHRIENK